MEGALLSYHSDPKIKDKFLSRVKAHAEADEIVKGQYWEKGKGCAVGCTIHSSDHGAYEKKLGLPTWLALLEDRIFEGLENGEAKAFPAEFLEAIPIGVDLTPVKWKFCAFVLKENIERVLTLEIADSLKKQVVDAIREVLTVHESAIGSGEWDESAAESARSAAESAAESAWSAARSARSAAGSAGSAAESAWSARSAAWSAAESAAESAWSAAGSAESAAESAWSARSAAWSAAESAAYSRYKTELLRLLREAK